MTFSQINWLAWAVGTVFAMVLGFLWYGPFFGKLWMGIMEKTGWKREEARGTGGMYALTLVTAAVSSYMLALIIRNLGVTEWWMGLVWGILVSLGVAAASSLNSSIFEGRRKSLWLLYGIYHVVLYGVLGLVFAVWR